MPNVTVTRRLTFNAAHRVFIPTLSDGENEEIFGKCSNPNWHGHNYVLEVSVQGAVDERTGYVLDLARLRDIVRAGFVDKVDHKNLNLDVDFMRGVIPTAENVVLVCWRILEPLVAPAKLKRIRLRETENNWVTYDGDGR
jgi:6-pyruvoyltetrahydropterin/6-carboxytetrahydropterin synthase